MNSDYLKVWLDHMKNTTTAKTKIGTQGRLNIAAGNFRLRADIYPSFARAWVRIRHTRSQLNAARILLEADGYDVEDRGNHLAMRLNRRHLSVVTNMLA